MGARSREPELKAYTFTDQLGNEVTTTAYLLGASTSEVAHHSHPGQDHAPRGVRCSACRWFEVVILDTSEDESADHDYLVYTCGMSNVPGERDIHTVVWTDSPRQVIEVLTVRSHGREPNIPGTSAHALAQASDLDEDIADAYDNRAVL